jgi:hypothetical protein
MSFFNGAIDNLTLSGGNLFTDSFSSGNVNIAGTTNLAGDIDVAGNLNAAGDSNFDQVTTNDMHVILDINVDQNMRVTGTSVLCGAVSVTSNLAVSGTTYLNNVVMTGTVTNTSSLVVTGGLTALSTFNVSGSSTLNNMVATGAVTASSSLNVSGASSLNTMVASGAVSANSSLNVSGNSNLNTVVANGAVSANSFLNVGGNSNLNTVVANGAVSANSFLNVGGNSNLNTVVANGAVSANSFLNVGGNSNLNTVVANGAVSANSTLNVSGNSTLNTMVASGAVSANSTLNVSGNSTLNTLIASGAVSANSTLNVSGNSTLNTLIASGAVSANSSLNVSGNSTLNTMVASGAMTGNSSLFVGGAITANSNLNVTGASILNNVTINSTLAVKNDSYFDGSLNIIGNIIMANNSVIRSADPSGTLIIGAVGQQIIINGRQDYPIDFNQSVDISGHLTATGGITGYSALNISGTSVLGGAVSVNSSLDVSGASTLNTIVASGAITANSSLDVSGNSSLNTIVASGAITANSSLDVSGASSLNTVVANGAITANSSLDVSGASSLNTVVARGAVSANSSLNVSGASTLNTVVMAGNVSANSNLSVSGISYLNNMNVGGTVDISGNVTLLSSLNFANIINYPALTYSDSSYNHDTTFYSIMTFNQPTVIMDKTIFNLYINGLQPSINGAIYIQANQGGTQNIGGFNTNFGVINETYDLSPYLLNQPSGDYPISILVYQNDNNVWDLSANLKSSYENSFLQSNSNGNFYLIDTDASASRLMINPSGYVGIGTTNPTTLLDVSGSSSFRGLATFYGGVAGITNLSQLNVGTLSANNLYVTGTSQFYDEVYINTDAYIKRGHFSSDVDICGNATVTSSLDFANTVVVASQNFTDASFSNYNNTVPIMTINQPTSNVAKMSLNLLINTDISGVNGNLYCQETGGAQTNITQFAGFGTAPYQYNTNLDLTQYLLNKPANAYPITLSLFQFSNTIWNVNATLRSTFDRSFLLTNSNSCFGIVDVDANTYRVTIDPSGHMGVGTSAPTALLDVAGSMKVTGLMDASNINISSLLDVSGATIIGINQSTVGLGNVNNTSDANKPISNATQVALNLKADNVLDHANIFCLSNVPTAANVKEYVPFSIIDTNTWSIDPSDGKKLICQQPGIWSFEAKYMISSTDQSGNFAPMAGWMEINDDDITTYGNTVISSVGLNGKTMMMVRHVGTFNVSDSVRFGVMLANADLLMQCTTFTDTTGVVIPSVAVTMVAVNNYVNFSSYIPAPTDANLEEAISIIDVDTTNWSINPTDPNNYKFICNAPGVWQFNSTYNVVASDDSLSTLYSWVQKNNGEVENSASLINIPYENTNTPLNYNFVNTYAINDYVVFGVYSDDPSIVVKETADPTAIFPTKSAQFTAINMNAYANMVATSDIPSLPNTNEYIAIDTIDTNNWKQGSNSTYIVCRSAGTWKFNIEYHGKNVATVDGSSAIISAFIELNGSVMPYVGSCKSFEKNNMTDNMVLSFTKTFKVGDILRFGIRSTSSDGQLNAKCTQGEYYNESTNTIITSPSVNITAIGMGVDVVDQVVYENYANPYSLTAAPSEANTKEYIQLDFAETYDWYVDIYNPTQIICRNEGYWEFVATYNMHSNGIQSGTDNLMGWVEVISNGATTAYSPSYALLTSDVSMNVLNVAYSGYINSGDKLKFGIVCNTTSQTPTIICQSTNSDTLGFIPSFSVVASKIYNSALISTNSIATDYPQTSEIIEYVPLVSSNRSQWLDISSGLQCVVPGRWSHAIQCNVLNSAGADSNNCEFSCWIEKKVAGGNTFSISQNSTVHTYHNKAGTRDLVMSQFSDTYNAGDIIRIGVYSSNVTNVTCRGVVDAVTNITVPAISIASSQFLNLMNLYSNITAPDQVSNTIQFQFDSNGIPFTNYTDTSGAYDWYPGQDIRTMVCKADATWKFSVRYELTSSDANANTASPYMEVNGNVIGNASASKVVQFLNGKSFIWANFVGTFYEYDVVAFGIIVNGNILCSSYIDEDTSGSVPSVALFGSKVNISANYDPLLLPTNYSTMYSKSSIPLDSNTNETVKFEITGNDEWFVNPNNKNQMICGSEGIWMFLIKTQLIRMLESSGNVLDNDLLSVYLSSTPINQTIGKPSVNAFDFYTSKQFNTHYSGKYAIGDTINVIVYNTKNGSSEFSAYQSQGFTDYTGVYTPSVNITAIRVPSTVQYVYQPTSLPAPNTNIYLEFSTSPYGGGGMAGWDISGDSLVCNRTGIYQLFTQQHTNNLSIDASASETTVTSWFERFDVSSNAFINIPYSTIACTVDMSGAVTCVNNSYANSFNKGDIIRMGARNISAGQLNAWINLAFLSISEVENYSNIYVNTIPLLANTNTYLEMDNADTNNWIISTMDPTQLFCKNTGTWQFIINHNLQNLSNTDISANNALFSSFMQINGDAVENNNVTTYMKTIGGRTVLTNIITATFYSDDLVQFLVNSISNDGNVNVNGVSTNDNKAVSITAIKLSESINFNKAVESNYYPTSVYNALESTFESKQIAYPGALNCYSNVIAPNLINTNQYVSFSFIDTNECIINPNNSTELICQNRGPWQFNIQYQVVTDVANVADSSNSMISTWLVVNGIVETDSSIDSTFADPGINTFTLTYGKTLNVGDSIKIGIRSNNSNVRCAPYTDPSGVFYPAISVTANNSNTVATIISKTNCPATVTSGQPTTEYLTFNENNSIFWSINPRNNTQLICRLKNTWQFTAQYQVYNTSATDVSASDATMYGWIERKRSGENTFTVIQGHAGRVTVANKDSINQLIFTLTEQLNEGDVVRFGVASFGTAQCRSSTDIFGTTASPAFISILMVGNYANIFCVEASVPSVVNSQQTIALTSSDTGSTNWVIDSNNNNKLICKNKGCWQFSINYNMVNSKAYDLAAGNGSLTGFARVNGKNIYSSNVYGTITDATGYYVLTLNFAESFNYGDVVEFGIVSHSTDGSLNVVCQTYGVNNIIIPAVAITTIKLTDYSIGSNVVNNINIIGDANVAGNTNKLSFFGATGSQKVTLNSNTLNDLLDALAAYGLIIKA